MFWTLIHKKGAGACDRAADGDPLANQAGRFKTGIRAVDLPAEDTLVDSADFIRSRAGIWR